MTFSITDLYMQNPEVWFKLNSQRVENESILLKNLLTDNDDQCYSILDAGCGMGLHAEMLSQFGFSVTAFDIDKAIVQIACKSNQSIKYILNANFLELPFASATFDAVVFMQSVLSYCDSLSSLYKAVLEARRVLAPRGRIIIDVINYLKLLTERRFEFITHSDFSVQAFSRFKLTSTHKVNISRTSILSTHRLKQLKGNKNYVSEITTYMYFAHDFEHILHQVGFNTIEFLQQQDRLLVIAKL